MKIYAHRGSSTIWPENTMLAFDSAHAAGADAFETDLRLSKDDKIIVSHDDNLSRFAHPDKTISKLTKDEIEQIQIKSLDARFTDKMISLSTLLERYPNKDYIFDCKITSELLMQKLKKLLDEFGYNGKLWFLTWSRTADDYVRKYFPATPCFPRERISAQWSLGSTMGIRNLTEPKNSILGLPAYFLNIPVFTKKQIDSIHSRGKEFIGYIVNTQRDFERCRMCGVRNVLTDRPDLIFELLHNRSEKEKAPTR